MTRRSQDDRRQAVRRADEKTLSDSRALVPVGEPATAEPESPEPRTASEPDPVFAAQLLGQDGQKRGLRGGEPVLKAARSGYLASEYSGAKDRRPPVGRKGDTEI